MHNILSELNGNFEIKEGERNIGNIVVKSVI